MSKVKIQGSASGSAVYTLTTGSTSTDRTITLPDGTGTLLTTDGDGSSLTGTGSPSITDNGNATAITINSTEDVKFHHNFTSASDGAVNGEWRSDWAGLQVGTTSAHYLALRAGNTEQLRITTDGRGLSQFTAKAWANFNQSTVNDSHNVSSITDNGTGDYTINFTNAMANANYSITGMARHNVGTITFYNGGLSTSVARVITYDGTTQSDRNACVTIFGD